MHPIPRGSTSRFISSAQLPRRRTARGLARGYLGLIPREVEARLKHLVPHARWRFQELAAREEHEAEPLPFERQRVVHPVPVELKPLAIDIVLPPPVLLSHTVLRGHLALLRVQHLGNGSRLRLMHPQMTSRVFAQRNERARASIPPVHVRPSGKSAVDLNRREREPRKGPPKGTNHQADGPWELLRRGRHTNVRPMAIEA